jgi:hypothetical protein
LRKVANARSCMQVRVDPIPVQPVARVAVH